TRVVGEIEPTLRGGSADAGVYTDGCAGRDAEPDPPQPLGDGRQAFADLLPRGAAIGRLEYPAAVHALVDLPAPRRDPAGPEHRIHHVRIGWIQHDLCSADVRA